jgi:hypothetical protein
VPTQNAPRFLTVLLLLALSPANWAQTSADLDVQELPPIDVVQCTHWLDSIVAKSIIVNRPNFCSGIVKVGETTAWGGPADCPESPRRIANAPRRFCTSYGVNVPYETFAVGVTSGSSRGRDFIDGVSPGPNDTAVLFVQKPMWVGDLLLAPGMYNLQISGSPEESTLLVTKQSGDAGLPPGSVKIKRVPVEGTGVPWLEINLWQTARSGHVPRSDAFVRELHFIWGDTNLFVQIRPDAGPGGSNTAFKR